LLTNTLASAKTKKSGLRISAAAETRRREITRKASKTALATDLFGTGVDSVMSLILFGLFLCGGKHLRGWNDSVE